MQVKNQDIGLNVLYGSGTDFLVQQYGIRLSGDFEVRDKFVSDLLKYDIFKDGVIRHRSSGVIINKSDGIIYEDIVSSGVCFLDATVIEQSKTKDNALNVYYYVSSIAFAYKYHRIAYEREDTRELLKFYLRILTFPQLITFTFFSKGTDLCLRHILDNDLFLSDFLQKNANVYAPSTLVDLNLQLQFVKTGIGSGPVNLNYSSENDRYYRRALKYLLKMCYCFFYLSFNCRQSFSFEYVIRLREALIYWIDYLAFL